MQNLNRYLSKFERAQIDELAARLVGQHGAVGQRVLPRRVGVSVAPRRVGAAAQMVQGGMNPVDYHATQYRVGENSLFPIGQTTITAGATGQRISFTPTRPFTPMGFYCTSTVQGLLIITAGIRGTNIFASDNGMPIEAFSEVSTLPQFDWPTLDPSTGIDLTVANPTGGDLLLSGGFYGVQVRD